MLFYIIIFMNKILGHKKYLVFLSISILFITSLFIPVQGRYTGDANTSINLSIDQLSLIVQQKLNQLNKVDYTIDTILPYSSEHKDNPLFYAAILEPTGFLIISTDYNLPPIMAYSFTSPFTTDSAHLDSFLAYLKTDITQRLSESCLLNEEPLYHSEWATHLTNDESAQTVSLYEQWPPEGYSETEGWIETQWHQDSPFNDLCPIDLDSEMRGVSGCPAVAMAQILVYHQTVNDVQFNDSDDYNHNYGQRFRIDDDYEEYGFPSFPELNDYVTTIQTHFDEDTALTDTDKAALIFACGTAATQVYSPQGSGTFAVSQAFDAYQKFNCEETELLTEDDADLYERIIQNIKIGLPVHLAIVNEAWSAGHNIIIDGYNTDDYYHLNFGWSGSYDGWYDLPDELPYELTVIEGAVVDILVSTDDADLEATGTIQLTDITPGATVNGSFSIQNNGAPDSMLSWAIESYPDWGSWDFSLTEGTDLTPNQGEIRIDVTIQVPEQKATTFSGGIKIINLNSPNDFSVIPLSITTPKTKQNPLMIDWLDFLQEHHPIMYQLIHGLIV